MNLTIQEIREKGKVTGKYFSHLTMNHYTIWELNWEDKLLTAIIHDNDNEISVIYNSKTGEPLYASAHTKIGTLLLNSRREG